MFVELFLEPENMEKSVFAVKIKNFKNPPHPESEIIPYASKMQVLGVSTPHSEHFQIFTGLAQRFARASIFSWQILYNFEHVTTMIISSLQKERRDIFSKKKVL